MPPLLGFSDNPFRTRDDLIRATLALLSPLLPYFSPAKARIRIPVGTAAHFDDDAAELEGFARPLWAIGGLILALDSITDPKLAADVEAIILPWITGFKHGTDPNHAEYWGDILDSDQRMVEAEIISFALIVAKQRIYDPLEESCRKNVATWLGAMNGKEMPKNNWLWFRVFANVALTKVCGVPYEEVKGYIGQDLSQLDSFYMQEGWSSDGPWHGDLQDQGGASEPLSALRQGRFSTRRQADYYSGSFAIQFSQLVFSKLAADLEPARAEVYRQRAREFGTTFWTYFDCEGKA
jgi:hypothetical protein